MVCSSEFLRLRLGVESYVVDLMHNLEGIREGIVDSLVRDADEKRFARRGKAVANIVEGEFVLYERPPTKITKQVKNLGPEKNNKGLTL